VTTLFRNIDAQLDSWFGKESRKPMVLREARQVGKTFSVRALALRQNIELVLQDRHDIKSEGDLDFWPLYTKL
jgi:hypothetical protein